MSDGQAISLKAHPRAQRHIAQAKGWGALAAFALVLYLSVSAGVPSGEATLRAIAGGLVGRTVAWGLAVLVWRQLAVAEVEAARRRLIARLQAAEASSE